MGIAETFMSVARTAAICAPTVVEAALGRGSLDKADARLAWWAKKLIEDAQVDLEVVGREKIPDGEPFVIMANHRSYYDIPVVFCTVPGRVRMVAKKELFRVPLFGSAMLAAGFVRIDRQNRRKAFESLKESQSLLSSGTRVYIAPEGTRSKTGELGPFKSGGFHMAFEAGVRILPIAIQGTERAMPASGLVVHRGARVKSTVLDPVDPQAFGLKRKGELIEHVRNQLLHVLGR